MNEQDLIQKLKQIKESVFRSIEVKKMQENSLKDDLRVTVNSRLSSENVEETKPLELKLSFKNQENYARDLKEMKKKIQAKFDEYFVNPSKFPEYKSEWESFWKVRIVQLKYEGKDPSNYDFTTEWSKYFLNRLEMFKENQLADAKATILDKYLRIEQNLKQQPNKISFKRSRRSRSYSRSTRESYSRSRSRSLSNDRKRSFKRFKNSFSSNKRYDESRSRSSYSSSSSSKRGYGSNSRNSYSSSNKLGRSSNESKRDVQKITPKHVSIRSRLSLSKKNLPGKSCKSKVTVISVCSELLNFSEIANIYRRRITDLMTAALDFEKDTKFEYCMTLDEYDYLKRIRNRVNGMLYDKAFRVQDVNTAKDVRHKMNILINRWMIFTRNGNRFPKSFKIESPNEIKIPNCLKSHYKRVMERIGERSSEDKIRVSKDSALELSYDEWCEVEKPNLGEVNVKIEPAENVQQNDVKDEIVNFVKQKENEEIVEKALNSLKDINVKEEKEEESQNLSASDLSNEEIIGLLNMFEDLSESEKNVVIQLMEGIECTDAERFNYLEKFICEQEDESEEDC